MVGGDFSSLTKEPPLARLDETIRAIRPGMSYSALLTYARSNTHKDAPGLISKRFLLMNYDGTIAYDHFLSQAAAYGLESPFIRKIMYFLWAYRDDRIRRYICEVVANRSGQWRVRELLNKGNSTFFEEWLQENTARKARSNFEYFIVEETKIVDARTKTVHLELDDGWLDQAAIAAAQHETDPVLREELLANPAAFLERRGWLGLLNITEADLPATSSILSSDVIPLQDTEITADPSVPKTGKNWDRKSPSYSGRTTTLASIDLVSRERANKSHFDLEELLAGLVTAQHLTPKWNQNIDMYFDVPDGAVLAEIKSCTDTNFHSQLRKGVSQLFEYRFLYKSLFSAEVTLLLLVETIPPRDKRWLIKYTESLGIVLAWKEPSSGDLVSSSKLPKTLLGIVTQVRI
jgi:hypothetical protein